MRDEYEKARKDLAIPTADFAPIAPHHYGNVTRQILERFTTLGTKGISVGWWWESFKHETWAVHPENVLSIVSDVLTPSDHYWLVAESWMPTKKKSQHWIFEGTGAAILGILGATHGHEYYIVERKMRWLLCENHHGVLIACGDLKRPNKAPEPTPTSVMPRANESGI